MRSILRHGNFPDPEAQLARGALAYAEGRIQQAIEILVPVDPRSLDPALGGQIALVQAALILSQNRQRAIESLALARLLAPGTLVDETALRRQISLVGQTQDVEAFAYLSRQYARRFKSSLYAEEFRESFTQTFMRIGIAAPEDQLIKLKPILESFEPDERCRLAILISRASLLSGAWRSAESFADTIMRPPIDPSCDIPRARFYRAAARAFLPKNEADLIALDRFDPDRLIPEDRALRRASLAYARIVRSFPDSVEPDTETKASLPAAQTLADAMTALAEADRLLQEKRK
jgi:chemotaxis protein MotC